MMRVTSLVLIVLGSLVAFGVAVPASVPTTALLETATTYSPLITRLRRAAAFAFYSYCPLDKAKTASCTCSGIKPDEVNFKAIGPPVWSRDIPDKMVRLFVMVDRATQRIVITVRGTQIRKDDGGLNGINWWHNAQANQEVFKELSRYQTNLKVHSGFYNLVALFAPSLVKEVKELVIKHPQFHILVTGHSLGGAMATIIAGHLMAQTVVPTNKLELITFGSPRVGNQAFANFMGERFSVSACSLSGSGSNACRSLRVVDAHDFVPHVGTPWMALPSNKKVTLASVKWSNYVHIPTEIWFPKGGTNNMIVGSNMRNGPNYVEDPKGMKSAVAKTIKDHHHYVDVSYCS